MGLINKEHKIVIKDLRKQIILIKYPLRDRIICYCGQDHSIAPKIKFITCACGKRLKVK